MRWWWRWWGWWPISGNKSYFRDSKVILAESTTQEPVDCLLEPMRQWKIGGWRVFPDSDAPTHAQRSGLWQDLNAYNYMIRGRGGSVCRRVAGCLSTNTVAHRSSNGSSRSLHGTGAHTRCRCLCLQLSSRSVLSGGWHLLLARGCCNQWMCRSVHPRRTMGQFGSWILESIKQQLNGKQILENLPF